MIEPISTRRLGLVAVLTPVLTLFLLPHHASAAIFAPSQAPSTWRVGKGVVAPWAKPGAATGAKLAGQAIIFSADRVTAPHPLGCGKARYEYVLSPAEGLFQGGLPAPAVPSARKAGIAHLPALTMRVSCDSGTFDYHFTAPGKAVIGLDNMVWPLARTGSPAAAEESAIAFLQAHMTQDMAFTPATVARKRALLSADLAAAIAAYFRQPMPENEPPPINGDPFTNSQEYPDRFVPGRAAGSGTRTIVPVRFGDDKQGKVVEFELVKIAGQWRLDDVRYEDGATLRGLLKPKR